MQKQPFPVRGRSKMFEDWGGGGAVKNVSTRGGEGRGGEVSTPLYAMASLIYHFREGIPRNLQSKTTKSKNFVFPLFHNWDVVYACCYIWFLIARETFITKSTATYDLPSHVMTLTLGFQVNHNGCYLPYTHISI